MSARGCCMVRPRNRSGVEVVDDYTVTAEDCALPSANIFLEALVSSAVQGSDAVPV